VESHEFTMPSRLQKPSCNLRNFAVGLKHHGKF
jgi:hypothetical protein